MVAREVSKERNNTTPKAFVVHQPDRKRCEWGWTSHVNGFQSSYDGRLKFPCPKYQTCCANGKWLGSCKGTTRINRYGWIFHQFTRGSFFLSFIRRLDGTKPRAHECWIHGGQVIWFQAEGLRISLVTGWQEITIICVRVCIWLCVSKVLPEN